MTQADPAPGPGHSLDREGGDAMVLMNVRFRMVRDGRGNGGLRPLL